MAQAWLRRHDALNRLTDVEYPTSADDVAYGYDDTSGGNFGVGRLTSVTDSTGSTALVRSAITSGRPEV